VTAYLAILWIQMGTLFAWLPELMVVRGVLVSLGLPALISWFSAQRQRPQVLTARVQTLKRLKDDIFSCRP
jgi:hypothetical protein